MVHSDKALIEANGATLKDMEAAAIAYVANLYHIPMFAVKSVTDLVDLKTPTEKAFLKNFRLATQELKKELVAIIDLCATSPLSTFQITNYSIC